MFFGCALSGHSPFYFAWQKTAPEDGFAEKLKSLLFNTDQHIRQNSNNATGGNT